MSQEMYILFPVGLNLNHLELSHLESTMRLVCPNAAWFASFRIPAQGGVDTSIHISVKQTAIIALVNVSCVKSCVSGNLHFFQCG